MDKLKKMHAQSIAVNLSDGVALLVFILNIICSGSGTILAGFLSGGDKVMNNLICGLLQYFLAFILIGWIWSIFTGYCIYKVAKAIPG